MGLGLGLTQTLKNLNLDVQVLWSPESQINSLEAEWAPLKGFTEKPAPVLPDPLAGFQPFICHIC